MTDFAVDHATLVTIRRAYMRGGDVGAMAELRRHCPVLTDDTAPRVLRLILTRQGMSLLTLVGMGMLQDEESHR